MVPHGEIDRWIVIIISEEPSVHWSSLELQVSYDVFLNTLCVILHVPDLIKSLSCVSQISNYKSRCLIYSPLCYYMRMCL